MDHVSQGNVLAASSSTTTTRTLIRRWVRRSPPIWPFVWRGLLPLLGLLALAAYALWPFARNDMQAIVKREISADLARQGMPWAQVDVSGQQVLITGSPATVAQGDAAVALARASTCPTWLGRKICATEVMGQFAAPAVAAAPPAPPPAPVAAPTQQAIDTCEKSLADIVGRSKIEFDTAKATLQPRSEPVLMALAKAAAQCPGVIRVEGHTDARGTPEANQALSEARAQSVRQALVDRGMAPNRLRAQGFGLNKPIASNDDEAGRARNRRIDFRVETGSN